MKLGHYHAQVPIPNIMFIALIVTEIMKSNTKLYLIAHTCYRY